MKHLFIILLCFQLNSCYTSQNDGSFNSFLINFKTCEFPILPIEIFHSIEVELQTKYISEVDFDKYLRMRDDSNWTFDKNHEYTFGGKFSPNSEIICLFYRRDYISENINDQIGEVILCTFNCNNKLISSLPIAGGYGDSVTFSSIIHSSKHIEVNYVEYELETVIKTSKHFEISDKGEINFVN